MAIGILWPALNAASQSSLSNSSTNEYIQQFYNNSGVASPLTGQAYALKELYAINNPLFMGEGPSKGDLIYDGIRYENQTLQYDMFLGQVIILLKSQGNSRYASLDTDKVSEFSVLNTDFIKLDSLGERPKGIYENTYEGDNISLYIDRSVNRHETTGEKVIKYIPNDHFYIVNDNGSFLISNKKSIKQAFNNSNEIKALIRKYNLSLSKRNREFSLINFVSKLDIELSNE